MTKAGTIKRLHRDNGFGFIRSAEGIDYFFLRTEVVNAVFEALREGQQIESFEEEPSERGPRAQRVVVHL